MSAPAARPWQEAAAGTRVVVRRRLVPAPPDGPHLTDVLGVVLRVDDDGLTLDTSRGPARIAGADVVLWKPIPPPPERRARRH